MKRLNPLRKKLADEVIRKYGMESEEAYDFCIAAENFKDYKNLVALYQWLMKIKVDN